MNIVDPRKIFIFSFNDILQNTSHSLPQLFQKRNAQNHEGNIENDYEDIVQSTKNTLYMIPRKYGYLLTDNYSYEYGTMYYLHFRVVKIQP